MSSLLDAAKAASVLAKKKGANDSAVVTYQSRSVDVTWRDGAVEKITEATTRGLGLSLYVDGRFSSVSTNDLRPAALDRFIEDAVALTRTLAPDPYRALPDPARYEGQAKVDLQLEDPSYDSITAAGRRKMAQELEAAARSAPEAKNINSVTSSAGDVLSESVRIHSNGFEGSRRDTSFYMGASVSVQDVDGRRPQGHQYASTRFFKEIPGVQEIGQAATRRATGRLGAKKMPSMTVTMAVENRAGGGLLGRLMGPLSAASIQQKRSFFEGRLDAVIGSPLLHITDNPLIIKGLGSRLYDGEGMAAKAMPIFENGAVKNVYIDNYYGRKLGWTANTGGSSNLEWRLGTKDEAGLLAAMKDGVFITGFLGGNSNGTTGDFSLGVEGFLVKGGKLADPIAEMNIAGNHLQFWKQLSAVGNDPYPYSSMGMPTLVFDGVQLAGI